MLKEKNKTKNITTRRCVDKTIIAGNGRYEYIIIKKFTILKEGNKSKNVRNTYRKCDRIPLLWIKFLLNIANKRDYVFNFRRRPAKQFDWYCREWYLYNNTDADDIRMLDDELNNALWLLL